MAEEGFNALHSVNKMLNCILHLRKESGRHILWMFVYFINFEGCTIISLLLSLFYFFVHLFHGENKYLSLIF